MRARHERVFGKLVPDLMQSAQKHTVPAGETLFYEDDPAPELFLHYSGKCVLSQHAEPIGEARRYDLLDPAATLGGLPHQVRATAVSDCKFLRWSVADLWQTPALVDMMRRYLAQSSIEAQMRRDQLAAPVHYRGDSAQLYTGPFVFKNSTMIIALCDADLDPVRNLLPDGLTLFRPKWRKRDSLFIALADFPHAYPDHTPDARFRYTETTFFVPVRYKGRLGLYVPYIYPSTYEPILLGREIYGFPKRLGETRFQSDFSEVSLHVDGEQYLAFEGLKSEPASEPRLVRALSEWMGIPGRMTEVAFRIGDTLLDTIGIPLYRRVSVYNHKRIPAATSTQDAPDYAVNTLTQAVFSVMQWHEIAQIHDGKLIMRGGPLRTANVELREAYFTRLDMRLSTGRLLRDYNR